MVHLDFEPDINYHIGLCCQSCPRVSHHIKFEYRLQHSHRGEVAQRPEEGSLCFFLHAETSRMNGEGPIEMRILRCGTDVVIRSFQRTCGDAACKTGLLAVFFC